MNPQTFWKRSTNFCKRRSAKWFGRRPFVLPHRRAIVSFTFDDFPRSALLTGGAILEQTGISATYYASLGIAGRPSPTGEIFRIGDIAHLVQHGHELGCHTFDHCPAWETHPRQFEASVARNAAALMQIAPGNAFRTLSYPISYPRPETKRRLARYFAACRTGGQTFNHGVVDLNYISAFFLEQSRECPDHIKKIVDANARAGGWLIFATHDVCDNPTRFGCRPKLLEEIARYVVSAGALTLPVFKALEFIGAGAHRCTRAHSQSETSPDPVISRTVR